MKVFNQIPAEIGRPDHRRAGRERLARWSSGSPCSRSIRGSSRVQTNLWLANRGEIALRIFRACRELGVETVAIFSEADRGAAYLDLADEAYCVGPPKAADSYLKIDRVISAAEIGNVQAIHPGYGFLAENPHFAEICRSCEIEFIGPTHEAMALVGDKNAARRLAKEVGVPTVPGSEGLVEGEAEAVSLAHQVGLSGADQGGGGRRRPRHARGPERSGAEGRHPAGPGRGRGRLRQRRHLSGKIRRASPPRRGPGAGRQSRQRGPPLGARLHDAAAAPEADRGEPRAAARSEHPHGDVRRGGPPGPRRQVHQRRHGGVHRGPSRASSTSSR